MLSEVLQEEIIAENFQLLPAVCFQGYLRDGKGILLLSELPKIIGCPHWVIPSHLADRNILGIYAGERGQAFQTIFRGNWGKLSSTVEEYNPHELSLVVFHEQENNNFSVFFLEEPQFNPVNNHRLLAPRLAEFFYR